MEKKKFLISVNEKYCKGCALCVNFCPSGAIEMNYLKVRPVDAEKCIGCRQCETRCPDFAIEIKEIV